MIRLWPSDSCDQTDNQSLIHYDPAGESWQHHKLKFQLSINTQFDSFQFETEQTEQLTATKFSLQLQIPWIGLLFWELFVFCFLKKVFTILLDFKRLPNMPQHNFQISKTSGQQTASCLCRSKSLFDRLIFSLKILTQLNFEKKNFVHTNCLNIKSGKSEKLMNWRAIELSSFSVATSIWSFQVNNFNSSLMSHQPGKWNWDYQLAILSVSFEAACFRFS